MYYSSVVSPVGNIKLTIINGKAITTSHQIAYYFNKRHKNVLLRLNALMRRIVVLRNE